jgi:hypothetical protein
MHIGPHVKYPLMLPDCNEYWIFLTDCRKLLKYQFSCAFVQWKPRCFMGTDGQTDRHDEANSCFRIFVNVTNNRWLGRRNAQLELREMAKRKTFPDFAFIFCKCPAQHGTGHTHSHIKFRQEVDAGLTDRQKNSFLGKYIYNRFLWTH